jgi:hypothetical protein
LGGDEKGLIVDFDCPRLKKLGEIEVNPAALGLLMPISRLGAWFGGYETIGKSAFAA